MAYTSKLIEEAVAEIATLPGIGKKTALRLALFLIRNKPEHTERLTSSLQNLRKNIRYCSKCYNIADSVVCAICSSPHRDEEVICIVENIQDVIAIENTAQYRGIYHVLGGAISPIEGIGPEDIRIDPLLEKVAKSPPKEIIFALSTTIEGDTTTFYIARKLKNFPVKLSSLARGLAVGGELEYTDELTLAKSINERIMYHS
jgi:recombination protein RecR